MIVETKVGDAAAVVVAALSVVVLSVDVYVSIRLVNQFKETQLIDRDKNRKKEKKKETWRKKGKRYRLYGMDQIVCDETKLCNEKE